MKTRIARYMALFALILGLGSCANDFIKNVNVSKVDARGYKIVLSVNTDTDTKAVKSAWEEGDCIYLLFADQIASKSSFADFTKSVYKGNEVWVFESVSEVDGAIPSSGTVKAFHFQKVLSETGAGIERAGEILFTDNGDYEVDPATKTIYVTLNMNQRPEGVSQISIADVAPEKSNIEVSIEGMKSIGSLVTFEKVQSALASGKSFSAALEAEEGVLNGFYNEETREYIVFPVVSGNESTSIVINDGYDVYHRTYAKALAGRQAIKVSGPFGDEAQNWSKYYFVDDEGNVLEEECEVSGSEKSVISLCKNTGGSFVVEGVEATSDTPSLFTVEVIDGQIIVTPLLEGDGSMTVSFKSNGISIRRTFRIKVNKNINLRYESGISIEDTIAVPVPLDEAENIKVFVNEADTPVEDYSNVTAESSCESVAKATVKDNCIEIAPVAYGTATITVTSEFEGKTYNNTFVINVLHNYRLLDEFGEPADNELTFIMNSAAAEFYLYDGTARMTSYELSVEGAGEVVDVTQNSEGKIMIAPAKIGETVLKLSHDSFSHSFAVTVCGRLYTMKNVEDGSEVTNETTFSIWPGWSVTLSAYDGNTAIKNGKYTASADSEDVVKAYGADSYVRFSGLPAAGGSTYVNLGYADEAGSVNVRVKVNVFGKPVITSQPEAEVKVSENGTATLLVSATGEQLYYQWQKATVSGDFSYIAGGTGSSYSFSVPMSMDGTRYRCAVWNLAGTVYSDDVVIKVLAGLPKITEQPKSEIKVVGGSSSSTAQVGVQATSSVTMNYQWQWSLDNTTWYNYSGKTAATITTTGNWDTDALNNGYVLLRCKITNTSGETTPVYSSISKLWFIKKPTVTSEPLAVIEVNEGSKLSLYAEANANHGTLRYEWQIYESSQWKSFTALTGWNTNKGYMNSTPYSYNGKKVRCQISNEAGDVYTNEKQINVLSGLPKITKQPESELKVVSGSSSSTTQVGVQATSNVSMNYQWQWSLDDKTWYNYSGKTTATITTAGSWLTEALNNGYVLLRCKITNTTGQTTAVYSSNAKLWFITPPTINSYPAPIIWVDEGSKLDLEVRANANHGTLKYEWQIYESSEWKSFTALTGWNTNYAYVNSIPYSYDMKKVRCKISNEAGTIYSNPSTLEVTAKAPVITSITPSSVRVKVKNNCTESASADKITVTATSSATMKYGWQYYNEEYGWVYIQSLNSPVFNMSNFYWENITNSSYPDYVYVRAIVINYETNGATTYSSPVTIYFQYY